MNFDHLYKAVVFVMLFVIYLHLFLPDKYSGARIAECRQAATFLNHQSNPMVHKWYMRNCSHLEAG
jgi:hypothetical protein